MIAAFGIGCGFVSWSNAGPVERARGVLLAPDLELVAESSLSVLKLPVRKGQTVHAGQTLAEVRDETAWKYRNELQAELQAAEEQVAEQTRKYDAELSRRMAQIDEAIRSLPADSGVELRPSTFLGAKISAVGLTSQPAPKRKDLERERLSLPTRIREELELDQLIAKKQECEFALAEWDRLSQPTPWTAPTGGIIASVHVAENAIMPDGAMFVTIQDTDHPKVKTELHIAKAKRLKIGRRVTVQFSSTTQRIGVVEAIEPGRRLAGVSALRNDPDYITVTIAPAEDWPSVRREAGVEIQWCDTFYR